MISNNHLEDIWLLTPMQQGMLFHSVLDTSQSAYFQQVRCRFEGLLQVELVQRTWEVLCQRHGSLRSAFVWEHQKEPMQVIMREVTMPMKILDWSALPSAEHSERLEDFLARDRNEPFKLSQAPLMRLTLICLAENQMEMIWTHHHLLLDGWSTGIVFQEFQTIYSAFLKGAAPVLPPIFPYQPYMQWLKAVEMEQAKRFWTSYLEGISMATPLPRDRQIQNTTSLELHRSLDSSLRKKITEFAQENEVTLNVVLMSCWALILSRYTSSTKILVGFTVSGRPPEVEGMETRVGLFINSLPILIDTDGKQALQGWLKEVQSDLVDLRAYERISMTQIKQWSEIAPAAPLFESLFVYENYPLAASNGDSFGDSTLLYSKIRERTNLPLTIVVEPDRDEFLLKALYQVGRISTHDMEQVLENYVQLLGNIVQLGITNPGITLDAIPVPDKATIEKILYTWNRTGRAYNQDQCIHELFEIQAVKEPSRVAVVGDHGRLNYEETNRAANRIAHHLMNLGLKPGGYVAIMLTRGIEMIPALLGILKAGGVYVPIEVGTPLKRVAYILTHLDIHFAVSQVAHLPFLLQTEALAASDIVCLDAEAGIVNNNATLSLNAREEENPNLPIKATAEAYVIFTSGSTGSPKGVTVTHQPVINLIEWVNREFGVNESDQVLFITSLSFDLSVYDVFGLLAAGGSIRVVSDVAIREPQMLVQYLLSEPITFWDSAPTALHQLVPYLPEGNCPTDLRLVFQSGDWIPITLPDRMRATFPKITFVSLGGATEATVWSNYFVVETVSPEWSSIPYGKPIQNAAYHILDNNFQVCAPGISGNLYIGGECLAKHYANAPDITAERFITDPFGALPGGRMFDTGDLACYHGDGNIEFLGRRDNQVKVRGFRVELGEIQSCLLRHNGIDDALAIVTRDTSQQNQIIAYIIEKKGEEVDTEDLKTFLAEYLPAYMIPSHLVKLNHFPVTANGKLDRSLLPIPSETQTSNSHSRKRAFTMVEELIWQNWIALLGKAPRNVSSNFFDDGGHSLLASRFIARMKGALGLDIMVQAIFSNPTVESFAQYVAQLQKKHSGNLRPEWQKIPHQEFHALSFAQERLWFIYLLNPDSPAYNVPITVKLEGNLDPAVLHASLMDLAARHEILRTTYHVIAGQGMQKIHPQPDISWQVIDFSAKENAFEAALADLRADALVPFDLGQMPSVRAKLILIAPATYLLQIILHHIACDGWSIGIIAQELSEIYRHRREGDTFHLQPIPYQYVDFAAWQKIDLEGQRMNIQIEYWRNRLQELPELVFPRSFSPTSPRLGSAVLHHTLGAAETLALRKMAAEHNSTLFMALQAAFVVTLHHITGQEEIVIGTDIACRTHQHTEGLIGFFVNQIVLRNKVSDDLAFSSILKLVRSNALEAYQHQDLPFEKLVQALNPLRKHGKMPFFQVKIVFQNHIETVLDLPGLKVETIWVDAVHSKYDLLITFDDNAELSARLEYSTECFDAVAIEQIWTQLKAVIEIVTASTDLLVTSIKRKLVATASTDPKQEMRRAGLARLTALSRKTTDDL